MKLQGLIFMLIVANIGFVVAMQPIQWIRTAQQEIDATDRLLFNLLQNGSSDDWIDDIQQALSDGADPNTRGGFPLIQAAYYNSLEAVNLLLAAGADPNLQNDGVTALYLVSGFPGKIAILKALLAAGANPNIISSSGNTPLIFAVNDFEEVKELLACDADPNIKNPEGNTALMLAAARGNPEIVQLLLDHNADRTATNKTGKSAQDFALKNNHRNIWELLSQPRKLE